MAQATGQFTHEQEMSIPRLTRHLFGTVRGTKMKIVALGDSLTVGESGFTSSASDTQVRSYPEHLATFAKEYLRSRRLNVNLEVLNKGLNGDLTSGMLERFSADVVDERADYVIILGGTNDIGWGVSLRMVSDNLTRMYDSARKERIGAVACSVPSILGCDELILPRLQLNATIEAEARKRAMPFLDFFSATADQATCRLLEDYSADGLHLNAIGYSRLGGVVFDNWLKAVLDQHQVTVE